MVPSCPRCGNEEDLVEWLDGRIYCVSCLRCGHDDNPRTAVCLTCLRQLHTVWTFEGPRIVDIGYYVDEAWRAYHIAALDLCVWTFAEGERMSDFIAMSTRVTSGFSVDAPPPHHRFG